MGAGASKIAQESLYDLLGVSSDVSLDELKSAYRSKARELHPDRNFRQEEAVTVLFAKVQAAYDLLSDVAERHYYDQHRLAGSSLYDRYDGNYTPAQVVREVTDTLVRQIDSSPQSFDYELIQGYFEKLKHEEQEAAFDQELPPPAISLTPPLGQASDAFAKVKPFYDNWQNFRTVKSYIWENIYTVHDRTTKQSRKKFDLENQKVREAAKREFDAAVRRAVLLLKQRDPRLPAPKPSASANQKKAVAPQLVNLLPAPAPTPESVISPLATLNLNPPKKLGKAKTKLNRKKQGHQHVLTCGTCGVELPGPELIDHKRVTRHP